MIKTSITELLDAQGVPYRILPHNEPVFSVKAAVEQRGVPIEEMVKSILLREKKTHRYVMACITGEARLDTRAVRSCLPGWKRLSFASAEEIQQVTGCVQGAIAPLCLHVSIPIIFDEAIAQCSRVNISSGDPLAGLELAPQDLIRLAGAEQALIRVESRKVRIDRCASR